MTSIPDDVLKAAKKLITSVEFDVNGMNGKGGNGGLTSNDTLHAAGTLRLILSRHEKAVSA
ncbi:hypothetical protein [Neorhizobium sp. DAR64872/K0K18]|uniref:hypothetical protein n=1 Tax=Neorhizobium sp. DAR64872/K0K18 TaxID=3421958 RepID=UPI003D2901E2